MNTMKFETMDRGYGYVLKITENGMSAVFSELTYSPYQRDVIPPIKWQERKDFFAARFNAVDKFPEEDDIWSFPLNEVDSNPPRTSTDSREEFSREEFLEEIEELDALDAL